MKEAEVNHIFTSLTRISDLPRGDFTLQKLNREFWEEGDYLSCTVIGNAGGPLMIELTNGRMVLPMLGDKIIGALGTRDATLEATGSWRSVGNDGIMHMLTGAGLLGKMSSKSYLLPDLIKIKYRGHLFRNGLKLKMSDYVTPVEQVDFDTPAILLVGTSMSAGKTVTGKIVTRLLSESGLKVIGAKLTGAGRLKDILALQDAGAQTIYDFVDIGLGSTILAPEKFLPLLRQLLSRIQHAKGDLAVVEIGASPLESYNGDLAIMAIKEKIIFTILCASDPYAVYGIMESFSLKPNLVSGPATNTLAGRKLIKNLCQVPSLNLIDGKSHGQFKRLLKQSLALI